MGRFSLICLRLDGVKDFVELGSEKQDRPICEVEIGMRHLRQQE